MANTQSSAVTDAGRLKEKRDTGSVSGSTASASGSSPERDAQTGRELVVAHQARSTGFFARFRYHILAAGFALLLSPLSLIWPREGPVDPTDYAERTRRVLNTTPLIDGHNDLPWQLRLELHNRLYDGQVDLSKRLLGHTDLLRMREGQVGAQFWSVYVDCDVNQNHWDDPSWAVRDTLEQIDVTKRFIDEHPKDLQYCDTPSCVSSAFKNGRIASMIGIEGAHQVGSSLASIRQMFDLGARYITLTHNCDNAFATSASTVAAGGEDRGLTPLGHAAVREMNRLGMLVDLSHVSHQTMRDVLSIARAPVIFSHSGAYSVEPHLRHVPDDVLRAVGRNGGIVMAVFVNRFLNMKDPSAATIHDVVDHILRISEVCGWSCVGIGSDFSGTPHVPLGLEDVSKFPALVQLVLEKGTATDEQARQLAGENLLRVWAEVETRGKEIRETGEKPAEEESEERWWHKGVVSAPWMLRGSKEKAVAGGANQNPHMFHVDAEGKHNPGGKNV